MIKSHLKLPLMKMSTMKIMNTVNSKTQKQILSSSPAKIHLEIQVGKVLRNLLQIRIAKTIHLQTSKQMLFVRYWDKRLIESEMKVYSRSMRCVNNTRWSYKLCEKNLVFINKEKWIAPLREKTKITSNLRFI